MTSGFDLTNLPGTVTEPAVSVSERTQAIEPVRCPVCGADNPPGEPWCVDCGFLLGSEPGEAPAGVAEDSPRLVDEATGRELDLVPGANGIGREGPEIVITDPSVSRRHARLTWDDSSLWLEDLGSSNGTRIDGVALNPGERKRLRNGQLVALGSTSLRVVVPGAEDLTPEEEPAAAPVVARLVRDDGTEYPIPASSVTLGRRPENSIVLQGDPYISGMHAQLLLENGGFSFLDLGSTNGSVVNGRRVSPDSPIRLADGDRIVLGRTELTFREQESGVGDQGSGETAE